MNKYLLSVFCFALVACSSPPKPVALEENANSINVSAAFPFISPEWVAQKGDNQQHWNMIFSVPPQNYKIMTEKNKVEFFYYLQHSEIVKISGATLQDRRKVIDYFVRNGVDRNVIFEVPSDFPESCLTVNLIKSQVQGVKP